MMQKMPEILGTLIGTALIAVGALVLFVVLLAAVSAIMAIPVYYLWNAVVPDVFALPPISYLQAWALSVLCGCLFKSSDASVATKTS